MSMSHTPLLSDYWFSPVDIGPMNIFEPNERNLLNLRQFRKAVSNFTKIILSKDINISYRKHKTVSEKKSPDDFLKHISDCIHNNKSLFTINSNDSIQKLLLASSNMTSQLPWQESSIDWRQSSKETQTTKAQAPQILESKDNRVKQLISELTNIYSAIYNDTSIVYLNPNGAKFGLPNDTPTTVDRDIISGQVIYRALYNDIVYKTDDYNQLDPRVVFLDLTDIFPITCAGAQYITRGFNILETLLPTDYIENLNSKYVAGWFRDFGTTYKDAHGSITFAMSKDYADRFNTDLQLLQQRFIHTRNEMYGIDTAEYDILKHKIEAFTKKTNNPSLQLELNEFFKAIVNIIWNAKVIQTLQQKYIGYWPYYEKVINFEQGNDAVSTLLSNPMFHQTTLNSYYMHMFFRYNQNSGSDMVPELTTILNYFKPEYITTNVHDSSDVAQLAFKIFKIVVPYIIESANNSMPEYTCKSNNDNTSNANNKSTSETQTGETETSAEGENDDSRSSEKQSTTNTNVNDKRSGKSQLTRSQYQTISDSITATIAQNTFEENKSSINSEISDSLEGMDIGDLQYQIVSFNGNAYGLWNINSFNKKLITTLRCKLWSKRPLHEREKLIEKSISLGRRLASSLQLRREDRQTIFTRQKSGKIDKRILASAGYGDLEIFHRKEKFEQNAGIVYITIDASGSMSGEKFDNALSTAIAIAVACKYTKTLECIISLRSTDIAFMHSASSSIGYIKRTFQPQHYSSANAKGIVQLKAYDSRIHDIGQIKTMFPYLDTACGTPEGLCFDSIRNELVELAALNDVYFVNFSDGMVSDEISQITHKNIKDMISAGVQIASFFISDSSSNNSTSLTTKQFKRMYGKDAKIINVEELSQLAKTLNKMFLAKTHKYFV